MSKLMTYIELRPGRTLPSAPERLGFELGWDHAHHGQALPAAYGDEPSPLRDGFVAGQATFGSRTLPATRHVRQWLQLRLHAWLHGRSVELVQVTPNYLQQIEVTHCPITRLALSGERRDAAVSAAAAAPECTTTGEATTGEASTGEATAREAATGEAATREAATGEAATREAATGEAATREASIDRVRHDAGYAAGNLALMHRRANHAKGANGYRAALKIVAKLEADGAAAAAATALPASPPGCEFAGLDASQWSRIAVLCSFVEALPHDEAAALPLLVLPPNRLRLFNPVQALQAFVSRQLLTPGWSQRLSRFEELLAAKPLQRDFKRFFMALLPRVLEAGKLGRDQATRWAIEDAWQAPLVQQRWGDFARQLSPARCEALLARAQAHGVANVTLMAHGDAAATDGWNLASRGYVPQGDWASDGGDPFAAEAQQQLAW